MIQSLLILFGTYLVLCYAWGMYVALRLHAKRRVRTLLTHPANAPALDGTPAPAAASKSMDHPERVAA